MRTASQLCGLLDYCNILSKRELLELICLQALVERCAERGYRPYFLGAKQEIVARVVEILERRHPALKIAGWRNGYWKPRQEEEVVEEIRQAKPDMLFVAMSSPKKELFLSTWKQQLRVPFVMGVGGTFDVVAGQVKRAPRWMQKMLEWNGFSVWRKSRGACGAGIWWKTWRSSDSCGPNGAHSIEGEVNTVSGLRFRRLFGRMPIS